MIRGLAMPGRGSLVSRLDVRGPRRAARALPPRAIVDAAAREIAVRLLDRRGRRERMVIALVLGDHLRSVEVAAALALSVTQVERTVNAFLADVARAVRRAAAPRSRVSRPSRTRALRSAA